MGLFKKKKGTDEDAYSVAESGRTRGSQAPLRAGGLSDAPGGARRGGRAGSTGSLTPSEMSEISAGPEKWRRVRRGAHMAYVPFDVELEGEATEAPEDAVGVFPPPFETNDNTSNWPAKCPFLHLKFSEFATEEKRQFIAFSYYFWYFLSTVLLFGLVAAVVTSLISPSPKPELVFTSFALAFFGFFWFFFAHFRLIYNGMRYRKGFLIVLYQLQTLVLFFIAVYQMFTAIGNIVQLLAPLAPGSAVPVRQNPMVAVILLGVVVGLWFIVMFICFYLIKKVHTFNTMPLAVEEEIYQKESRPGFIEAAGESLSERVLSWFREKPDKPLQTVRCGMLQGKDLWLQGQITFDTVYVEFKADVHCFDHLVWERYHFQDILDMKTYSKSGILLQVVNPSRRGLEDLEVIFDFHDKKLRTETFKAARKLWRRVGRNMDLIQRARVRKLKKLQRSGLASRADLEEPDLVEAFNKARRFETKERLENHLITYKDWEKVMGGVSIRVLQQGEALLTTGDDFTKIFHVAQGMVEVAEALDTGDTTDAGSAATASAANLKTLATEAEVVGDGREARSWAKYAASRQEGGETKTGGDPEEELEYEDPEDATKGSAPLGKKALSGDSDSSESAYSDDDIDAEDVTMSGYESQSVYSVEDGMAGPEMVTLGIMRKDDIFGIVPFLLTKDGQVPKSGLTFTAREEGATVVFALDSDFLKKEILKPKKEVTAAFFKYLAALLGERTEAAEDAMFTRKVREKRLEVARAEEDMLAKRRQDEEERGGVAIPSTPEDLLALQVRQLFNFSAAEQVAGTFKGRYTYTDPDTKKVVKISGDFYVTSHYFAFAGKKMVDFSQLDLNHGYKVLNRHDEMITIRYEGSRGVLFIVNGPRPQKALFEVKSKDERERLYTLAMSKWKKEDEVTAKEMRKLLRRKMTRLSLGYLNATERVTQQTIGSMMSDLTEKDKKQLFAGCVPIGLNRNQVIIDELNFNENLYLLCTGITRVQRVQEHAGNMLDSGKALDRVVFQELHSGEIFGFDSFLTGSPAYSSIVVDSEKAVVRSCTKEQIMARLREDRRLAAKFYRIAAISIASRLAEISPLDIYL